MRPGVKRWGLRLLAGGVVLYLICWTATWVWGTTAVRASQRVRLQAEVDRMPPLINSMIPGVPSYRPYFSIGDTSTPAPFLVIVGYSQPSRGGAARWLWTPWESYLLDDRTTWVE